MSTKILSGYITRSERDLRELLLKAAEETSKVRKETPDKLHAILKKEGSYDLLRTIITKLLKKKEGIRKGNPCSEKELKKTILKSIQEESENLKRRAEELRKGYRCPGMDIQLEIAVFPKKTGENKNLVIIFTESLKLERETAKNLELEDYHFQNSEDKPKRIKSSEWKKREKDWNLALPSNSTISQNCWITSSHHPNEYADILEDQAKNILIFDIAQMFLPQNVKSLAEESLHLEQVEAMTEEWQKENPDEKFSIGWFSQFFSQSKKDGLNPEKIETRRNEIQSLRNPLELTGLFPGPFGPAKPTGI